MKELIEESLRHWQDNLEQVTVNRMLTYRRMQGMPLRTVEFARKGLGMEIGEEHCALCQHYRYQSEDRLCHECPLEHEEYICCNEWENVYDAITDLRSCRFNEFGEKMNLVEVAVRFMVHRLQHELEHYGEPKYVTYDGLIL